MKVKNKNYRTIWMEKNSVFMVEQNLLPFEFKIFRSENYSDTAKAIKNMTVRGAGAIGAAGGFAMAQAFIQFSKEKNFKKIKGSSKNYLSSLSLRGGGSPKDESVLRLREDKKSIFRTALEKAKKEIESTRPTAQNLFYAVNRVFIAGQTSVNNAILEAKHIADEDAAASRKIGELGNSLIKNGFRIETHCNAGWLAFVDYGTALSPIYAAHKSGKNIFVYVDETRPRGQGAKLTAWELQNEKIPHAIIPDNAGAYLMSQGKVDMFIVGADRIAANGDVANKIGTLEKAIVAKEYRVPFYVAAPSSTISFECPSGKEIPIEQRSEDEVFFQTGMTQDGKLKKILVCSPGSSALNPAFDVTPAKYITGIITEKGIYKPGEIKSLKKKSK